MEANEQVKTWLIEGHSERDIKTSVAEHYPEEDATALIAAAALELIEDGKTSLEMLRGWAINAYRETYRRAFEIGDFSAALRAIDKIYAISKDTPEEEGGLI